MNEKVIQIKDLFEEIATKENVIFEENKIYYQKTPIKIQNEKNEWIQVDGLMIKTAKIFKVIFDSGIEFEAADEHLICTDGVNCKFIKDLIPGDLIIDGGKNIHKVLFIEDTGRIETVYDLSVASDTYLYQTADGLIHHNTFEARKILKAHLGAEGDKWVEEGGAMSSVSLYQYLFENNGKIILLDDLTGPLDDKQSIDILKKALDSNEPRKVSYKKMNIGKGELEGIPNEFVFTGKVIFITNKSFYDIPGPIRSRCQTVNVDFTPAQTLDRVRSKLKVFEPDVPMKIKEDIMEFLSGLIDSGVYKGKLDFRKVSDAIATWLCTGVPLEERKKWIYFALKTAG